MKRIAESFLNEWFNKKERMPLIIRGARQVGKSTLVHLFAENRNLDLIEFNLENSKFYSLDHDEFKLRDLLDEIELKSKKTITKNTLLFFDEIQESPELLKSLRYFFEEAPQIAVVVAGSLLEFTLKDGTFSFPVGRVEFYNLGPMSFTEFLWATENTLLANKLSNLEFSSHVVTLLEKELVKYYYIGGMPKAVKTYVESGSMTSVRGIQNQILQTYIADFPKYNSRIDVKKIEKIFFTTVLFLGKKIIYQKLEPESQSRDIKRIIELLIDARVLLPCIHTNANTVPLLGESDLSIQKLYFLDIGLVNALTNLDLNVIDQEFKSNFNTKGMLAEQFVAQHLAYSGDLTLPPRLFYWLKDKGSQKGEVDFLISYSNKIVPIEVKSTKTGHLKSLFYFVKEKKSERAIKISLSEFSKEVAHHKIGEADVSCALVNIPQYATEYLFKILATPTD